MDSPERSTLQLAERRVDAGERRTESASPHAEAFAQAMTDKDTELAAVRAELAESRAAAAAADAAAAAATAAAEVRPGIIHAIWYFLPYSRSILWSFTPNDVDDTGAALRRGDGGRRCRRRQGCRDAGLDRH
jgi:hypothetical protein